MSSSALPFRRFLALLAMIAMNIVLRRYGQAHGLSPFMVRLGAGALWAAAIYFVVALLLRSRPRKQVFIVAAALCALIELSKLSHTPALDILRLTPVGAGVLGRIFAWTNFAAYAAGLIGALGLDGLAADGLRNPFRNPFGKTSRGRRR
jgi:hypothetical protein